VDFGKAVTTILVLVMTLLGSPASSEAQDTEVAGSLSWLWFRGDYARWLTYPGWSVDFAQGLTPHLSVAVEVGGNYRAVDYSNGWSESHRAYVFAAGPKVVTSTRERLVAFGQVLVGVQRFNDTIRTPPAPDFNSSSSSFVIHSGGGVDVTVARQVAVRVDISAVIGDPWHSLSWQRPEWRLGLGGVYRW